MRAKKRLVVAREELSVDLNALAKQIGAPRFSFGKTERMTELLRVPPGSVNPFAVMNDRQQLREHSNGILGNSAVAVIVVVSLVLFVVSIPLVAVGS